MGSIVISDVVSDISRFPQAMVVGDPHETSSTSSHRRTTSRPSSLRSYPSQPSIPTYTPQRIPSVSVGPTPSSTTGSTASLARLASQNPRPNTGASSRLSAEYRPSDFTYQHQLDSVHLASAVQSSGIDGYDQSGFPLSSAPRGLASSPPSPRLQPTFRSSISLSGSVSGSPNRIKVRDLSHIQSFASEEVLTRSRQGSRHSLRSRQEGGQQYEISAMPVTDIIEMVAGLLTKITTTNDRQHEHNHRLIPPAEGNTGLSQQTTSMLAFHGKNVPSITILSYLSRIHKYCPTTYEVFLSLLVYFDRMTEMINSGSLECFRKSEEYAEAQAELENTPHSSTSSLPSSDARVTPHPPQNSPPPSPNSSRTYDTSRMTPSPSFSTNEPELQNLNHFFVVDSFNIHRLVIAGVTCASKFFSDVFYTNSRYAKVSRLMAAESYALLLTYTRLGVYHSQN